MNSVGREDAEATLLPTSHHGWCALEFELVRTSNMSCA